MPTEDVALYMQGDLKPLRLGQMETLHFRMPLPGDVAELPSGTRIEAVVSSEHAQLTSSAPEAHCDSRDDAVWSVRFSMDPKVGSELTFLPIQITPRRTGAIPISVFLFLCEPNQPSQLWCPIQLTLEAYP